MHYLTKTRVCKIPRIQFVVALLVVCAACISGCRAPAVSAERILRLEPGQKRFDVERRLGQVGTHLATANLDGAEIVVTTHNFKPTLHVYIVYRDRAFEKITPWVGPPPAEPDERLLIVMQTPGWPPEAIMKWLTYRQARHDRETQPFELSGPMMAMIITAPLSPIALPRVLKANALDTELANKFDPYKARLGMTVSEVETMYGSPTARRDGPAASVRAYGQQANLGEATQHRYSPITVHFRDGRVTGVFSHAFYDHSLDDPRYAVQIDAVSLCVPETPVHADTLQ